MALRRWSVVLLAASVLTSMGAQYRTQNFDVQAPTKEVAKQVGDWAEYYRKAKAMEWLGHEMPTWQKPCPLIVTVTSEGPSGATSFVFHPSGGVLDMKMEIKGPLDRLLASVLPHEITHTVFAHYFRHALPRWADEGGSVLSEDDVERERHDKIVRGILNRNQNFRLRQLFTLADYPQGGDKVMCLYAQGFSVSHYLVYISNRQTFLRFVDIGQREGWDKACQTCFSMRNVEDLEEAWLKHLRDTKGMSITELTKNKEKGQPVATAAKGAGPGTGTLVRLTAPPADPLQPVPVVRGAMPESTGAKTKPGYLPEYAPGSSQQSWQVPEYQPIPVQLGAPQYPQAGQQTPQAVSPAGFPRQ
jgi:hypothetical protein